jgi:transcriptional regulator with XRE-family HTH domain
MSTIIDSGLDVRLGERVRAERETRGWSLTDLADRSGVSRAMINKIERGESSPTASLLGRLSGALGLTLSELLARTEASRNGRLLRAAEQPVWRDPETGYIRRQIAPIPGSALGMELVQVQLPPGAAISFPAAAYTFIRQLIWVLKGRLTFVDGTVTHELCIGDCLELGAPADRTFRNPGRVLCEYLVAVAHQ